GTRVRLPPPPPFNILTFNDLIPNTVSCIAKVLSLELHLACSFTEMHREASSGKEETTPLKSLGIPRGKRYQDSRTFEQSQERRIHLRVIRGQCSNPSLRKTHDGAKAVSYKGKGRAIRIGRIQKISGLRQKSSGSFTFC